MNFVLSHSADLWNRFGRFALGCMIFSGLVIGQLLVHRMPPCSCRLLRSVSLLDASGAGLLVPIFPICAAGFIVFLSRPCVLCACCLLHASFFSCVILGGAAVSGDPEPVWVFKHILLFILYSWYCLHCISFRGKISGCVFLFVMSLALLITAAFSAFQWYL